MLIIFLIKIKFKITIINIIFLLRINNILVKKNKKKNKLNKYHISIRGNWCICEWLFFLVTK